ncbi:MAG: hypothetical protein DMF73_13065 [Acidobacteria bacterium]|nr:MAG: hypothetical protein DMF73_13065 [Acidobacteriota bacterium]
MPCTFDLIASRSDRQHFGLTPIAVRDRLSPDAELWLLLSCDRFCLRGARIFQVRWLPPLVTPKSEMNALIMRSHEQERKNKVSAARAAFGVR